MEQDTSSIEQFDQLLQAVLLQLKVDRPGSWSPQLENTLPLDLHILEYAIRDPEIILKEIRERLAIPNSTLTSAIDRLERRGLLRRKISQRDRRSYGLELTEAGLQVQLEHERVHRMIAAAVLEQLNSEDQQVLTAILKKLQSGLAELTKNNSLPLRRP
jgi:DNA-binding MarR family transcriptional regulator